VLGGREGALECNGHVPVTDGLVTDDGHEWRKHEYDEADSHRRTDSGEGHGKREHRRRTGEQGEVEGVNCTDKERLQA
jgi:hypothetical protein